MIISAIVAMSENNVIGKDNQLVWHLPADLQHFKRTTYGHHMLMGRKTFESFGKVLPGRVSIILTRQEKLDIPGAYIVHTVDDGLEIGRKAGDDEFFIIGGEEIFRMTMPLIEKLYLTVVHENFDGDTFFPELNWNEWTILHQHTHEADDKNPYRHTYYTLLRKM
jgi:dihydrofolate reductase